MKANNLHLRRFGRRRTREREREERDKRERFLRGKALSVQEKHAASADFHCMAYIVF